MEIKMAHYITFKAPKRIIQSVSWPLQRVKARRQTEAEKDLLNN